VRAVSEFQNRKSYCWGHDAAVIGRRTQSAIKTSCRAGASPASWRSRVARDRDEVER
jgi:hypothetical protein